jgi:hypothetical protein
MWIRALTWGFLTIRSGDEGIRTPDPFDAKIVPESEAAGRWAEAVGLEFHEVHIETNAHDLTLVFSDVQVSALSPGYAPFVVSDGPGPEHKFGLT